MLWVRDAKQRLLERSHNAAQRKVISSVCSDGTRAPRSARAQAVYGSSSKRAAVFGADGEGLAHVHSTR